jgi:hypothetical protein
MALLQLLRLLDGQHVHRSHALEPLPQLLDLREELRQRARLLLVAQGGGGFRGAVSQRLLAFAGQVVHVRVVARLGDLQLGQRVAQRVALAPAL